MTQSHFIAGTTLTLLLAAVAVLGNAPSATADSSDVSDTNPDKVEVAPDNDAVLQCDPNELRTEDSMTHQDERENAEDDAATPLDMGEELDADVEATQPEVETSELARRVSAALLGQTKPANVRVARATKTSNDAAEADRVWRCGHWEELWQGRGNARTCEWK